MYEETLVIILGLIPNNWCDIFSEEIMNFWSLIWECCVIKSEGFKFGEWSCLDNMWLMKIFAKAGLIEYGEWSCLDNRWKSLQRQGLRDNFEYLFSELNNRAKDMSEVFGIQCEYWASSGLKESISECLVWSNGWWTWKGHLAFGS